MPVEVVLLAAVPGLAFIAPRFVTLFLLGYLWFLGASFLHPVSSLLWCESPPFGDILGASSGTRCWPPGWRESFQNWVVWKVSDFPGAFQEWIYCVLLGDRLQSAQTRAHFKVLGIYHLLIISGLHFAILIRFLYFAMILPWRLCYTFALISPASYLGVRTAVKVAAGSASVCFGFLVGWPPPVQRAFLTGAINILAFDFLASVHLGLRIIAGLVLQTLLFPYSFMSSSNIVSWVAYVELVRFSRRRTIRHMFLGQIRLCLLVGSCLGYVSLVGVLINLLLVPLFPLILVASLVTLFAPYEWSQAIAGLISRGFSVFDDLGRDLSRVPLSGVDLADYELLRVLLLFGLVLGPWQREHST